LSPLLTSLPFASPCFLFCASSLCVSSFCVSLSPLLHLLLFLRIFILLHLLFLCIFFFASPLLAYSPLWYPFFAFPSFVSFSYVFPSFVSFCISFSIFTLIKRIVIYSIRLIFINSKKFISFSSGDINVLLNFLEFPFFLLHIDILPNNTSFNRFLNHFFFKAEKQ